MEVKLKERFLGNGLYKIFRRAVYKVVAIDFSVIASRRRAPDLSFYEMSRYRYEVCRKNKLEAERKIAQASAEAHRQALRY